MQVVIPGGAAVPGARDENMALAVVLVDPVTGNPVTPASGGSAVAPTGVSGRGAVGTSSTAIVAAGAWKVGGTIQNTHATNTLYVAFGASATTNDFAIAPGAALSLSFGPANAINALGSATGTTYATIGA
jgi:hypothetical protein